MKELGETLLKITSGSNLDEASMIFVKLNKEVYSLGVISKASKTKFITFKPSIKDKSFYFNNSKGSIEHFTLVNLDNWHITCKKNKNFPKILRKETTIISEGIIYWFGMSVKNIDNLFKIPNKDGKINIQNTFSGIPENDSERRMENFIKFAQNTESCFLKIDNYCENIEHYYHFEFFIVDKNINTSDLGIFCPVVDNGVKVPINVLRLKMNNFLNNEIVVSVFQVPGKIDEPVRIWFQNK